MASVSSPFNLCVFSPRLQFYDKLNAARVAVDVARTARDKALESLNDENGKLESLSNRSGKKNKMSIQASQDKQNAMRELLQSKEEILRLREEQLRVVESEEVTSSSAKVRPHKTC